MNKNPLTLAIGACALNVQASDWIQLTPAGDFRASDGRPEKVDAWHIDAALAHKIIAQFDAQQNDMVIDYEHQVLLAVDNGQKAPAAGWVDELQWREGSGLYGHVTWTATAAEHIAAQEYRYLSPVFEYDPKTGAVQGVLMAALVNTPAIDGMQELASLAQRVFGDGTDPLAVCSRAATRTNHPNEENTMDPILLALLKALGIEKKDATEESVLVALKALQDKADEHGTLTTEIAVLKANPGKDKGEPDPAQYVPIGVVKEMQGQITALQEQHTQEEADELIAAAKDDRRLVGPEKEKWARKLAKTDLPMLKELLGIEKPIAALARLQTGGKPLGEIPDGETEESMAVASLMGVSADDRKKYGVATN